MISFLITTILIEAVLNVAIIDAIIISMDIAKMIYDETNKLRISSIIGAYLIVFIFLSVEFPFFNNVFENTTQNFYPTIIAIPGGNVFVVEIIYCLVKRIFWLKHKIQQMKTKRLNKKLAQN